MHKATQISTMVHMEEAVVLRVQYISSNAVKIVQDCTSEADHNKLYCSRRRCLDQCIVMPVSLVGKSESFSVFSLAALPRFLSKLSNSASQPDSISEDHISRETGSYI